MDIGNEALHTKYFDESGKNASSCVGRVDETCTVMETLLSV